MPLVEPPTWDKKPSSEQGHVRAVRALVVHVNSIQQSCPQIHTFSDINEIIFAKAHNFLEHAHALNGTLMVDKL